MIIRKPTSERIENRGSPRLSGVRLKLPGFPEGAITFEEQMQGRC